MKKKILALITVFVMVLSLCACGAETSSSMSYTYKVSTGDNIKVELDTSGGKYKLENNGDSFSVKKDDVVVLQGAFGTKEDWEYYSLAVDSDELADVQERQDDLIIWKYDGEGGTEYDLIEKVGSETCVFMGALISSDVSESTIKEAIGRITLSKTTE